MLNDYIVLPYEYKSKKVTIYPLADMHIGASNCMISEIRKVIKTIEETPNTYCILAGDIIDNGIVTGKIPNAAYDNNYSPLKQIEKAVELLKPIKDKILAVVSGNHEARSEKAVNMNPLYLICSELGIQDKYRNNLAIAKIQVGSKCNNEGISKRQTYTLLIHHGKGSSETAIKKDHDFINSFEGADCIITGHTHQQRAAKFKKKIINKQSNIVSDKEITTIVCNSFLDDSDYALKNMLTGSACSIMCLDLIAGKKKNILVHM